MVLAATPLPPNPFSLVGEPESHSAYEYCLLLESINQAATAEHTTFEYAAEACGFASSMTPGLHVSIPNGTYECNQSGFHRGRERREKQSNRLVLLERDRLRARDFEREPKVGLPREAEALLIYVHMTQYLDDSRRVENGTEGARKREMVP